MQCSEDTLCREFASHFFVTIGSFYDASFPLFMGCCSTLSITIMCVLGQGTTGFQHFSTWLKSPAMFCGNKTRYPKPKHGCFLTLSKWISCLNLTQATQCCHNTKVKKHEVSVFLRPTLPPFILLPWFECCVSEMKSVNNKASCDEITEKINDNVTRRTGFFFVSEKTAKTRTATVHTLHNEERQGWMDGQTGRGGEVILLWKKSSQSALMAVMFDEWWFWTL